MKSILTIIIAAMCVVGLYAQDKKKVVIETSLGADVEESAKNIFMMSLSNGLTNSGQFIVLTNRAEYMAKLGEEIKAQESGLIADSQMMELGKAAGCDCVVYVNISVFDGQYFIIVQMTEVETGISQKTIDPIMCTRGELVKSALDLAKRLAKGEIDSSDGSSISANDIEISNVLTDGYNYLSGYIDKADRMTATYQEAHAACVNKGEGWRLPTIDELKLIYSKFRANSQMFGNMFQKTVYWSQSARNGFSVYCFDFSTGSTTYVSKTSQSVYRCVKNK